MLPAPACGFTLLTPRDPDGDSSAYQRGWQHALVCMTDYLEAINREQAHSETDPFTEGRYRQFARHLGPGFTGRVLDVGCNTGRGGQAFLTVAPRAVLDGAELLADRIARIPPRIYGEVYEGTLAQVPSGTAPYDALLPIAR